MLKTFTLKNGIKVVTYSLPQMRSVYISLTAKSGSIFDTAKNSGAAHYMEHILFEGTPSFPTSESYTQFLESLAGTSNAYTSSEVIKYYISLPSNHLMDGLRLAGEVFFEPTFPEPAIEKERNAIFDEINQRKDSLWYKNSEFFKNIRYKPDHPLLLDAGGSVESVQKLQKSDLVDYWNKFFFPQNSYLTIVGNINSSEIEAQVEDVYKKYTSDKQFSGYPNITNADYTDRTVAIRHDKELNTCYIDFSWPAYTNDISLQEQAIAGIVRYIIGGSQSSRLNRILRIQKGLVYGVGFWHSPSHSFGLGGVSTSTSLQNLDRVLEIIVSELVNFFKRGATTAEIKAAQNYSINRTLMSFDQPDNIAAWITGDLLYEEKFTLPDEYVAYIKKVDNQMIKNFIKKYYDLSKLSLTIQGPLTDSPQNHKKYNEIVKLLK